MSDTNGLSRKQVEALDMPSAVREGGTERSGDGQRSDEPQESARPSDGRTEPQRLEDLAIPDLTPEEADAFLAALEGDPTCGEALGDMRCQLKRGHDGQHEDWRDVADEAYFLPKRPEAGL